ncbi:MAG: XRE family transcriptional regulator [Planctomycetota bacterium]
MSMTYPEALINPAALVWVRTQGGYTPEEMATKASVSPERYEQWEHGEERPSLRQLFELAGKCHWPLSMFYMNKMPPGEPALPDFRRLPETAKGELSSHARLELRLARERRAAVLELLPQTEGPPDMKRWEFVGSATRNTPIPELAAKARQILGVTLATQSGWTTEYQALNGWKQAFEDAGIFVFQCSLDIEEFRAAAMVEKPYPVVLVNTKDAPLGRVFSLLHELGHIFLGQSNISSVWDGGGNDEVYCNRFAAETLMPGTVLAQDRRITSLKGQEASFDDVHGVARRYWVSAHAAALRMKDFGIRTDTVLRKLIAQATAARNTPRESEGGPTYYVTQASHLGTLLIRSTLRGMDENVITIMEASKILGVKAKNLEKLREHAY